MGKYLAEDAVEAIQNMKAAVAQSQQQLAKSGLEVMKVEVELLTTLTKSAGGVFKLKIVEIGAHRSRADTQTLTLDLTPTPPVQKMGPTVAEQLQQAILATAAASVEAADTVPRFTLERAVVALDVAITTGGKLSVFVEGSAEHEAAHTLTLTLRPNGETSA